MISAKGDQAAIRLWIVYMAGALGGAGLFTALAYWPLAPAFQEGLRLSIEPDGKLRSAMEIAHIGQEIVAREIQPGGLNMR